MIELEYAKNPQFNSAEGNQINLIAKFSHINEEVPFLATSYDVAEHGRDIFARALAGEFGEIAPYEPPSIEFYESEVRFKRDTLLSESDWTQLPDVPQSIKDLWQPYRQALRDVPQQPGFPMDVVWPVPPA